MKIEPIDSDVTIVYPHIPKTAGSTLHKIIDRQYPKDKIYSVGLIDEESIKAFNELSIERKNRIRMFRGHMSYGVHRFLPGHFTYFTMLREPVERVISYYYFIKRTKTHYLHDHLCEDDVNLTCFIENKSHVMIDNAQTRILSGVWQEPEFGACDREILNEAKRNLQRDFAAVGLVEKFDESLLLFARLFGWRRVYYCHMNVSYHRPSQDECSDDAIEAIVSSNLLDLDLYDFACELFAEQLLALGPDFDRRVNRFKMINGVLSPWIRLYWIARSVSVRVAVERLVSKIGITL